MEPKTREEALLANIAGGEYNITPLTEKEKILVNLAGGEYDVAPSTREEFFLNEAAKSISGGGGGNPNRVDTITGTLQNPFNMTPTEYADFVGALQEGGVSAVLAVDASILGFGIVDFQLYTPNFEYLEPNFIVLSMSDVAFESAGTVYYIGSITENDPIPFNSAAVYIADTLTPISKEDAAYFPTTLTIIWHPLPEN